MATTSRKNQRQATVRIVLIAAILVVLNILASLFHAGIDLTQDKRFTLAAPTKRLLRQMKDVAVVTVYLQGDKLPAEWKRLQEAVRERLQTFRDLSGNRVVFQFEDPFAGKSDEEQGKIFQDMSARGMFFIPVQIGDNQSRTEQKVFPFASVRYMGREAVLNLLENHTGMDNYGVLNYSESLLEYKFATAVRQLSMPARQRVGYIVGHGEALGLNTIDALTTLSRYYDIDTIDLPNNYYIPSPERVIIVNKPTRPFDDKEKFKIDQYVMNGGRVIWAVDPLDVPMDTLIHNAQYLATDYGLNLDDLLFSYGVRLNPDLIEDRTCNTIPIVMNASEGGRPRMVSREWPMLPVFTPESHHPVVNNMDAVKGIMVSSIDTIADPEVKKTILIASSKYSRTTPSPVRINLSMLMQSAPAAYERYNRPYRPVAVLSEGNFASIFRNRLHPGFLKTLSDSLHRPFKAATSKPGAMIVLSDGDFFLNSFTARTGPMDMGDWQYSNPPERFANKSLFLNCVEYLADSAGLLEARSKTSRLRLLDASRVQSEKSTWQFVNVVVPVIAVLILASVYLFFRKRKYEQKSV